MELIIPWVDYEVKFRSLTKLKGGMVRPATHILGLQLTNQAEKAEKAEKAEREQWHRALGMGIGHWALGIGHRA